MQTIESKKGSKPNTAAGGSSLSQNKWGGDLESKSIGDQKNKKTKPEESIQKAKHDRKTGDGNRRP
jgi:hypothetical protein